MTTLPLKESIILDHRYWLGTFFDFSGYSNHGTLLTGVEWSKNRDTELHFTDTSLGVQIAHSSEQVLIDGTLIVYNRNGFGSLPANGRFISKQSNAQVEYSWYNYTSTQFRLFDGSNTCTVTMNQSDTDNFYAVTFVGGEIPRFFKNGVFESLGSSIISPTVSTNNVMIGGLYYTVNVALEAKMKGALIYNTTLSDTQIAQVYEWTQTETTTPSYKKKNFFVPSKINARENGLVAAWDMENVGQKILDLTGNGNDGTITGCMSTSGPVGKSLWFDGERSYVDIGNTSQTIKSVELLVKIAGNNKLIDFDGGTKTLETAGSKVLATGWTSPTYYVDSTLTDDITNGWKHIVVTSETGVLVSDLDIGRVGSTYGGSTIRSILMYDSVLSPQKISALYKDFARTPIFIDDFQDANESISTETSGFLSNTDWRISTGGYKIARDETNRPGKKHIECVTAGVVFIPSQMAYGTWEFTIYKALAANTSYGFIGTKTDPTTTGNNGYILYYTSTNIIRLARMYNGAVQAYIGITTLELPKDVYYDFRITRRHDGLFSVYVKGGSYSRHTKILTGTDYTYVESKYMSLEIKDGDRIANLKFYQGVV